MSSEPGVSILQADFNYILFSSYSRVEPKRRVLMNGKLRNLREYVEQELTNGNLRQALSLVLQVAKGSNYSFCFTYDSENLEGIIHKCV